MDNYPDNIRYPGDTNDPASPFYNGPDYEKATVHVLLDNVRVDCPYCSYLQYINLKDFGNIRDCDVELVAKDHTCTGCRQDFDVELEVY